MDDSDLGYGAMAPFMSDHTFTDGIDVEPSEEVKIAIRLMKAGNALDEFIEYIEEENIDLTDREAFANEDFDADQMMVLYGYFAFNQKVSELAEILDDDSDESPFKVSDGDDPVY
mgnify:CR=1 FL=1